MFQSTQSRKQKLTELERLRATVFIQHHICLQLKQEGMVSSNCVTFKWQIALLFIPCCGPMPLLRGKRVTVMLLRAAGGVRGLAAGGHCAKLAKSSSAAGLQLLHHQLAPLQEGTCSSYSPGDDVVVNVKQGRLPASGIKTSPKKSPCFVSPPSQAVQREKLSHVNLRYSLLWVERSENCVTSAQESCRNSSVVIY